MIFFIVTVWNLGIITVNKIRIYSGSIFQEKGNITSGYTNALAKINLF